MRRQLEESYNIQKITQLEDEQKNKQRILKQLQEENRALVKVQKDQEKALQSLSKENDYEKKIYVLNVELKKAKEHLRKLQQQKREDEKSMKIQHETLIMLEEKCRKMALVIKEKKKKRQDMKKMENLQNSQTKIYTKEDLRKLEEELKQAEQEKVQEEKKLKDQVKVQDSQIKQLQIELSMLTQQVKEKDQEYRLNELKIKELRRQLPSKVLKPIDARVSSSLKKGAYAQSPSAAGKMGRVSSQNQLPETEGALQMNAMGKGNYSSVKQIPKAPKPIQTSKDASYNPEMGVMDKLKSRKNSQSRLIMKDPVEQIEQIEPKVAAQPIEEYSETPAEKTVPDKIMPTSQTPQPQLHGMRTPAAGVFQQTLDSEDQAEVPKPVIKEVSTG